jgi:carboxymethylenebutenolidase
MKCLLKTGVYTCTVDWVRNRCLILFQHTFFREKSMRFVMSMLLAVWSIPALAGSATYGEGLTGYLAIPKGKGPFPALVLIHEWWGLNDNVREFANRFARKGYLALAVDLYDGKVTKKPAEARKLASAVRADSARAFHNLKSAVWFLKGHRKVDEKRMGAVGWCFGGGWSWQMAKNDLGVKASVIYYGRFNPRDDLSLMRARILGHFGEKDRVIPVSDVKAFRAVLQRHGKGHEVFVYENAGHGFANRASRHFHPDSAKRAWTRTMAFLKSAL